jgi:intraflagellar transport protein 20
MKVTTGETLPLINKLLFVYKIMEEIQFDEFCKARIVNPNTFEKTTKLRDECVNFNKKIAIIDEDAQKFLSLFMERSKAVETQKSTVISLGNKVTTFEQRKKAQKSKINSIIHEKEAELHRLIVRHDSLIKEIREQEIQIDFLQNK